MTVVTYVYTQKITINTVTKFVWILQSKSICLSGHNVLFIYSFNGQEQLRDALKGADLVVIPAGVPRKPGNI